MTYEQNDGLSLKDVFTESWALITSNKKTVLYIAINLFLLLFLYEVLRESAFYAEQNYVIKHFFADSAQFGSAQYYFMIIYRILFNLTLDMLNAILVALPAIAFIRFIILNEAPTNFFKWTHRHTQFVIYSFVLYFLEGLWNACFHGIYVTGTSLLNDPDCISYNITTILKFMWQIILDAKFSLVCIFIALDMKTSPLMASWSLTSGNFWRFYLIIFITSILSIIDLFLVFFGMSTYDIFYLILNHSVNPFHPDNTFLQTLRNSPFYLLENTLTDVFWQVINLFPYWIFGTTALAVAYKKLNQK